MLKQYDSSQFYTTKQKTELKLLAITFTRSHFQACLAFVAEHKYLVCCGKQVEIHRYSRNISIITHRVWKTDSADSCRAQVQHDCCSRAAAAESFAERQPRRCTRVLQARAQWPPLELGSFGTDFAQNNWSCDVSHPTRP